MRRVVAVVAAFLAVVLLLGADARDASIADELARRGRGPVRRCVDGCGDVDVPIAMAYGGRIPVVMASIDGHDPVPLVVDTGSDLLVLTPRFVSKLGVDVDWDSTGVARTLGGERRAWPYAVAERVRIGATELADVPFAVIGGLDDAAWGDTIAGIVNPALLAAGRAVTLDLADYRLRFGPVRAGGDVVRMPYLTSIEKPVVVASVGRSDPVPLVVDSGAWSADVVAALVREVRATSSDEAETSPDHHADGAVDAAGIDLSAPKADRLRLRADEGDRPLRAVLDDVRLVDPPSAGRVGTAFLLGRVLGLDPSSGLYLSATPRFPTFARHDRRTVAFDGSLVGGPFTLDEEIEAVEPGAIRLRIGTDWHGATQRYRMRVPYSPRQAYRWGLPLQGRSCEADDQSAIAAAPIEMDRCAELFVPFSRIVLEDVRTITGDVRRDPDRDGWCTDERSEGVVRGRPVDITETTCWADPWLVERGTVVDRETGEVLLSFRS